MELSGIDLKRLSGLLDEALELEPEQRAQWIAALESQYEDLREVLTEMLLRRRGVETADFLRQLPEFSDLPARIAVSAGDMVGPYKLLRELGSGATSEVWLAERVDGALQRKVAVKLPHLGFIDHKFVARMERERDILAGLEHPNIARLYDAGVDFKGRPYLALEYVDGVSPSTYCAEHSPNLRLRLELFLRIAQAVAFAHGRLIVHRDLKPNNILVTGDGDVRLLDFGIARLLQADLVASPYQTQFGARALTPAYAAPEQFTNQLITVATDVYSLGVILYELLTGRSPYSPARDTLGALEDSVLKEEPPLASSVAPRAEARALRGDLDTILAKALKKSPQDRYASVEAFGLDIERHLEGLPIAARPQSFWYVAKKFSRRNALKLGATAVVVVVLAQLSGIAAWQWKQAVTQRTVAQERLADAEAAVDFSSFVLSEGMQQGETITIEELLSRSESVALDASRDDVRKKVIAASLVATWYAALGLESNADALLARTIALVPPENRSLVARLECLRVATSNEPIERSIAILEAQIERTRDDPATQAQCLFRRSAVASSFMSDSAGALKYSLEALRQYRLSGGQSLYEEARILGQVGYAYSLSGQPDLALTHFDQSIALLTKAGRAASFAMRVVRGNAGIAWFNAGNPLRAIEQADASLAIDLRQAGKGRSPNPIRMSNRATLLAALGRYPEAQQQFEAARSLFAAEHSSVGDKIYVLAGEAAIAIQLAQLERARALLAEAEDALKNSEEKPHHAAMVGYLQSQAMLWAAEGRSTDAEAMFVKVIDSFTAAGCCIGKQARALAMRADLLTQAGHLDQAMVAATRSLELARKAQGGLPYSFYTGESLSALARVQEAQGRYREAREGYALAAVNLAQTVGEGHPDTSKARNDAARTARF